MISFVSFCFVCSLVLPCGASEADTDYYWKDYYNNQVPLDAIPGGFESNGKRTFIAGLSHPNVSGILLPGNLYSGSYAEAQPDDLIPVHTQSQFVRVLCSQHHQRYAWHKINITDFDKLNGIPVRGGYTLGLGYGHDTYLYLGRAASNEEIKVGKVIPKDVANSGLWLPHGSTYKYFEEFEILLYYPPLNLYRND